MAAISASGNWRWRMSGRRPVVFCFRTWWCRNSLFESLFAYCIHIQIQIQLQLHVIFVLPGGVALLFRIHFESLSRWKKLYSSPFLVHSSWNKLCVQSYGWEHPTSNDGCGAKQHLIYIYIYYSCASSKKRHLGSCAIMSCIVYFQFSLFLLHKSLQILWHVYLCFCVKCLPALFKIGG